MVTHLSAMKQAVAPKKKSHAGNGRPVRSARSTPVGRQMEEAAAEAWTTLPTCVQGISCAKEAPAEGGREQCYRRVPCVWSADGTAERWVAMPSLLFTPSIHTFY